MSDLLPMLSLIDDRWEYLRDGPMINHVRRILVVLLIMVYPY